MDKWIPVSELDQTNMHFVLTWCDGAIRTLLWTPVKGVWEHPHPFGEKVALHEYPSHYMKLPEGPEE